ncbi:nitric oxide-associated protein 1 [Xenentodon cancila]
MWTSVRRVSAAGGEVRRSVGWRSVRNLEVRSCTVDPNLEEKFVFVDCSGPEEDPHQEEEELVRQLRHSATPPLQDVSLREPMRVLEDQLQLQRGEALQEAELDSLIQFQDMDFPLDKSLVADFSKKKKMKRWRKEGKGEHKIVGTPDVNKPVSDTCCSGCGAILHCTAPTVPGYLPSEKFKVLLQEGDLGGATCQRCHLLTHHHKALHLEMTRNQYQDVVRQIRSHKALVLLIVDLIDLPDSIVPNLPHLVGTNKHVVVLGNKIDLLPGDSPNYLQRIKRQLFQYCRDAGFGDQVTDVHLISAKTGYGIEVLISSLQRSWKYKGDVYLVGSANAGKSTLFNTLLDSDYCRSRATDVIQKATISPWPGTTLNLLRFPIINPTPYRMFQRQKRLKEAGRQMEEELQPDELRRVQLFSRQGYLVGRVGRTFRSYGSRRNEIQFDPDSLAFGENEDEEVMAAAASRSHEQLSHNELKDAHWLYDTPGILKEFDVLQLLQDQEVRIVVPTRAVIPRTFVMKPGTVLFVGALFRIDFLQGGKSCWFSVMASSHVPVHVTSLEKADSIYEKHAGHALLGVPVGGSERMKQFPVLVPQEFWLEGQSHLEAAADIKLSSAGSLSAVQEPLGRGGIVKGPCIAPECTCMSIKAPVIKPESCDAPLPSIVNSDGSVIYSDDKPLSFLSSFLQPLSGYIRCLGTPAYIRYPGTSAIRSGYTRCLDTSAAQVHPLSEYIRSLDTSAYIHCPDISVIRINPLSGYIRCPGTSAIRINPLSGYIRSLDTSAYIHCPDTSVVQINLLSGYTRCLDTSAVRIHPLFGYTRCPDTSAVRIHPLTGYICSPDTSAVRIHQLFGYTRCLDTSAVRIHPLFGYTRCPDTPAVRIHPLSGYIRCPDTSAVRIHPLTGYICSPDTSADRIHLQSRYIRCSDTSAVWIHPLFGYTRCPDTSAVRIHPLSGYIRCPDTPAVRIHPLSGYTR